MKQKPGNAMQSRQPTDPPCSDGVGSKNVLDPAPMIQVGERSLRILLVEDSPDDAELIGFALRKMAFAFSIDRVETGEALNASLDASTPDVVLCDHHLPRFSM